jgi:hypothetical protein
VVENCGGKIVAGKLWRENCGGKIQFMIRSGALIPWALFPQIFLLLEFYISRFYISLDTTY